MNKLRDVLAYLIGKYPRNMSDELSNARLTKMVYLADWKHALENGTQITNINWYFDNYGPFVRDIEATAIKNPQLFKIQSTTNMYGQYKKTFSLKDDAYVPNLEQSELNALNHIIDVTKVLYWKDFIKLVYSTHPIASSERYTYLDLPVKAREYMTEAAEDEDLI